MERLRDNTRGFLITSNGLPNEFTLADAAPHNVLSGTTSADADYDGLHIGGFLPALSKTGANPILHFSSFAHKPSAYSSMNPSTSPSPCRKDSHRHGCHTSPRQQSVMRAEPRQQSA